MNNITLLYFFSALAQSAAAFIALIAVFSVFRLQNKQNEIKEKYLEGAYFLGFKLSLNKDAIFKMSNKQIENQLQTAINTNRKEKEKAEQLLNEIDSGKDSIKNIVYETSKPMKKWAIIFFVSLIGLICNKFILIGNILIALSMLFILYALFNTKSFIQKSLGIKKLK